MLVYRDGRRAVSSAALLRALAAAVRCASNHSSETNAVAALLRAGEFECGLADAGAPAAEIAGRLTDACAEMLVAGACVAGEIAWRGRPRPRDGAEHGLALGDVPPASRAARTRASAPRGRE